MRNLTIKTELLSKRESFIKDLTSLYLLLIESKEDEKNFKQKVKACYKDAESILINLANIEGDLEELNKLLRHNIIAAFNAGVYYDINKNVDTTKLEELFFKTLNRLRTETIDEKYLYDYSNHLIFFEGLKIMIEIDDFSGFEDLLNRVNIN